MVRLKIFEVGLFMFSGFMGMYLNQLTVSKESCHKKSLLELRIHGSGFSPLRDTKFTPYHLDFGSEYPLLA